MGRVIRFPKGHHDPEQALKDALAAADKAATIELLKQFITMVEAHCAPLPYAMVAQIAIAKAWIAIVEDDRRGQRHLEP